MATADASFTWVKQETGQTLGREIHLGSLSTENQSGTGNLAGCYEDIN